MGLIKCPDCGKDVSDQAAVCPSCARPIRPASAAPVDVGAVRSTVRTRPATSPVTWGCLALIVFAVLIGIIGQCTSSSDSPAVSPARMDSAPRTPEKKVISIPNHIESDPRAFHAALRSALGSDAVGERTQQEQYWITSATFPGGKMQVWDQAGRLDQVNVWFDEPYHHRDDVLAMFGFSIVGPTKTGPGFYVWEREFGLDRLHMLRVRDTNDVTQVMFELR